MEREVYCQDGGRTRLKPKKHNEVQDKSGFRESKLKQLGCRAERTGETSEDRVFAGRAWNASRNATDVRADKESRREHLMSGQGARWHQE